MVMPAFDREHGSTSAPDGNPMPLSNSNAAAIPQPASPETSPPKAGGSQTAPTKPPAASLISIAPKNKVAVARKAGDLTQVFELARRKAEETSAPAEPVPDSASEPVPTVLDGSPEPELMSIQSPVAESLPEPEIALESSSVESTQSVEPMNASDAAFELAASSAEADFPLMLAPPETEDVLDLTVPAPVETAVEAEPLMVAPVLAADIAAGVEIGRAHV